MCAGFHKDADIFIRAVIWFILLTRSVSGMDITEQIVCAPGLALGEHIKMGKTRILTTKIIQSPRGRAPTDSSRTECNAILRMEGRGGSR